MMATQSWRADVLKQFTPGVARLTVVADPDGLLLEEGLLAGLRERGFELLSFEDPVAFRFAYESKYRERWERGESTDLVVVLRSGADDLRKLPFDLLQAGRQLSFGLVDLFPNLSYPVVSALDRADLEAVYRAQASFQPRRLGDNATRDFVLRHVFEVVPELVKEPRDLLRLLLRRHLRDLRVPPLLDHRLIEVLRQEGRFADWPLERLVPNRADFLGFLQERWPVYLDQAARDDAPRLRERAEEYRLDIPGPAELPFGDDDVRVYVDTLFLEGRLRPIEHPASEAFQGEWLAVGVQVDPQEHQRRRLAGLVEQLAAGLPDEEARHLEWLSFARRWAEAVALRHAEAASYETELLGRFVRLHEDAEARFEAWALKRYSGLYNQPPMPPVMLHHVARSLARRLLHGGVPRIVLVVVDGLALDQWVIIREALAERGDYELLEGAVFAWVPTITSVSRQALFAGEIPLFFADSLDTTAREPALWQRFWANQGLGQAEVAYHKGLGRGGLEEVDGLVSAPRRRVVGLVVNVVDNIMHGMQLGTAGMHNQVRLWTRRGWLAGLLDLLLARGYEVHLTSDHGNVEAHGMGRPAEGQMADLRGERVRVYPDDQLRDRIHRQFPESICWPTVGLPERYRALLARGRHAFMRPEEQVVGHGGMAIEEVIVPLVRVRGGGRC